MDLSGMLGEMDGLAEKGDQKVPKGVQYIDAVGRNLPGILGGANQLMVTSQFPGITRILTQNQLDMLNAQGWNEQSLQKIATQSQLDMLKAQGAINQSLVSTAPAGAGGPAGGHGALGGDSLWSNPWTWAAIGGLVLLVGGGVAYKRRNG